MAPTTQAQGSSLGKRLSNMDRKVYRTRDGNVTVTRIERSGRKMDFRLVPADGTVWTPVTDETDSLRSPKTTSI